MRRAAAWSVARDRLGVDLREKGYDASVGAYTAAYDSSDLDAAVLLLPLVGVEPADSPRLVRTIDVIRARFGAGADE